MKFACISIYFVISMLAVVPIVMSQGSEDGTNELRSENYGRFVRYAKHHEKGSNRNAKARDDENDDHEEKNCDEGKDEGDSTLKRLGWFKSFIHHEDRRHEDAAAALSSSMNKHEKVNDKFKESDDNERESDDDDDENSEGDESDLNEDENFEYTEDDHSKIARSADSSFLDPGTAEVCGENGKCNNNNNGQDRVLGFESASGNSKKTSNIALKAAQEAMAAESAQETAGKEASKQAKFQLAEKAIQAAKAGQAALSAKQSIVEELERELRESEVVVQDLSSSIQQSEANANAALRAATQAAAQLKMLTEAVQTAQSNLANSEQAAQGAQQELSEKTQLLEAAKNRVESLLRELKTARADYANTKQAAFKAASAAKQAKSNASRVRREPTETDADLMQKILKYVKTRYQ